jgi:hypothetical protein
MSRAGQPRAGSRCGANRHKSGASGSEGKPDHDCRSSPGSIRRHGCRHRGLPRQGRQDHHLSFLGGPSDPAVRDDRLLPRRRQPDRLICEHSVLQPPVHDCPSLSLPVRTAGRRRSGDDRAVHAATRSAARRPATSCLPVTAQTTGGRLTELEVSPFDPTQPAPHTNGLNSNYDYIGASGDYQKRNPLWCAWDGERLSCSPRS